VRESLDSRRATVDFAGSDIGRNVTEVFKLGRFLEKNKRPAGKTCEPSGGLLWIDQEVVTLRGL